MNSDFSFTLTTIIDAKLKIEMKKDDYFITIKNETIWLREQELRVLHSVITQLLSKEEEEI